MRIKRYFSALAAIVLLFVLYQSAEVRADPAKLIRRRTPVVEVFEKCRDAVVNIAATHVVETRTNRGRMFDYFFDSAPFRRRQHKYTSLGSGFVIHPEGYVVTNAHVVLRAVSQKVIFADKSEYEAERIAVDEEHDLAVLKIKAPRQFPAIQLGRSDDLMIGETAIAIGNPLGYENTVTTGIISALDRTLDVKKDVAYKGLIQTDASINPGNSGGPLLNVLGELIGINTAIRSDAQNIGFAIPVDSLRKLLPEMLSLEQHRRWSVGLRLDWRDTVYVTESRGPAAKADIEAGDILLKVNGKPVKRGMDFYIELLTLNPGEEVVCKLERNGEKIERTIKPEPIPAPDGEKLLKEKFGLSVHLLDKKQARQIHPRLRGGLIITEVEPRSPADYAGLKRGHLIIQLGRYFPNDLDTIGRMLEEVQRADKVMIRVLEVQRGGDLILLEGTLVAR